ncbi:MAG TPA: IS5/IS1182 family transposase, partial [Candidatus Babeliales bacterium]|nr:IS5/IS1182 family transposase [Candidatus Babeliales bacterium]HEV2917155.1 IS5/IS1182 family transposase [Candidatus Babeliales bacterium]HEV2917156.1 IS5/IS1182 family transposase [Candidatus Babeliales bacterium]HEV2917171.1 IS5/IS1182 family transposase [Candidatus Babeliales bacterium]
RIECFFSKIKYFRRIFSRFDKSKRNFFSFVSLVGALIWLR